MEFLNRHLAKGEADPLDFSPPLLRLQESPPNPVGHKVLWAILILIGSLILWALIGRLDIVVVADGKLVPQSYVKIVQPSEAGIVKEILVREGETVKAGQTLLRMDAILTDADANALEAEFARKQLILRRIDAELSGKPFTKQPTDQPLLADEVAAQYRANKAALDAALAEEHARLVKTKQDLLAAEQVRAKLAETLPHYKDQEKAFQDLAKDGYVGPLQLSDKRRERIEKEQELKTQEFVIKSAQAGIQQSQKRLNQIESDYNRQLYAERNEVANAIDKLAQEVEKQTYRKGLLDLKAPQEGVIKDLATHTAGTVVQPGTVLLTLVPTGEILRAEVWVPNEDIGFIYPGQPVKMKFAAFPFQKYGMAEGIVEYVSADAVDNNTTNGPPISDKTGRQPLVYKAFVSLNSMQLKMDDESYPLTPGMQTSAEILLGTRTIAEYLLSPVKKAWHEAGRER